MAQDTTAACISLVLLAQMELELMLELVHR